MESEGTAQVTTTVYYMPHLHAYRYVIQVGAEEYAIRLQHGSHRFGQGQGVGGIYHREVLRQAGWPQAACTAWLKAYHRVCAEFANKEAA